MPILTNDELLALIDLRKAKRARSGGIRAAIMRAVSPSPWDDPGYPGDDTFFEWPGTPAEIKQTHFYYFGPGAGEMLRTVIYRLDGSELPTDRQFQDWIAHARGAVEDVRDDERQRDLDLVEWHHPGYLVFFVDFPGWGYLHHQGKNKSLHFAELEPMGEAKRHRNHSFFNAVTHPLEVDGRQRELLVVTNHHFKAPPPGGTKYSPRLDPDPSVDEYKFDIFVGFPIEPGGNKKQWIVLDPGGKNMGPP